MKRFLISFSYALLFAILAVILFKRFDMGQFLMGWMSCVVFYTAYSVTKEILA